MKNVLRLEQTAFFALSIFLFNYITELPWYFYALLFFTPDITFIAYTIDSKIGAIIYNFFHHQGIWLLCSLIGYFIELEWLLGLGIIYVGHSAFDRIFGYGLKYFDSFHNTHLGIIGNNKNDFR